MALMIIPKPNPPRIPVKNRNLLLLSLCSNNCVMPSINAGIKSNTAETIKYGL